MKLWINRTVEPLWKTEKKPILEQKLTRFSLKIEQKAQKKVNFTLKLTKQAAPSQKKRLGEGYERTGNDENVRG